MNESRRSEAHPSRCASRGSYYCLANRLRRVRRGDNIKCYRCRCQSGGDKNDRVLLRCQTVCMVAVDSVADARGTVPRFRDFLNVCVVTV